MNSTFSRLMLYSVASLILGLTASFGTLPTDITAAGASAQKGVAPSAEIASAAMPPERVLHPEGALSVQAGFNGNLDPKGRHIVSGLDEPPRFVKDDVGQGRAQSQVHEAGVTMARGDDKRPEAPTADGDLDPSFDGDGKVTTNWVGIAGSYNVARAMTIQPDGKIVAAGVAQYSGGIYCFALTRHNANGSLDSSFNSDGRLLHCFDYWDSGAYGVAVQPDGKIVMVGASQNDFFGLENYFFSASRDNADGSPDTAFAINSEGYYCFDDDFPSCQEVSVANGVAIQPDGKIVIAGYTTQGSATNFALARLLPNGDRDNSFDGNGMLTTDFFGGRDEARAVTIQPDGKIVVAGAVQVSGGNYDFAVARYNSNGSLDATFSGDGKATFDFFGGDDGAYALALQPDGKIVVAGGFYSAAFGYDFGMLRFLSNGTLDTSFGGGGYQAVNFVGGTAEEVAYGVALQADGKIVLSGYAPIVGWDFALARLLSNGALDTSFSGDGKLTTDFAAANDKTGAVAIQSDGKIVAAGEAYVGTTNREDFALARYLSNELPTPTSTRTPSPTSTRTATVTGTIPTSTSTATATNSATPTNTPCPILNYTTTRTSGTIVPGTTDIGNHCAGGTFGCVTSVPLPFSYTLYTQSFNTINVSSAGNAQFIGMLPDTVNSCNPGFFNYTILPLWDDLRTDLTGAGIFTSVSGSAPNRIFNIEWRANYAYGGQGSVNFELRLYEGQTRFEVIYGAGSGNVSATGGVVRNNTLYLVDFCNGAGNPASGLVIYQLTGGCPPTNTPTYTATTTPTMTNTATYTPSVTPSNTPTRTNTTTSTQTATNTRTNVPTFAPSSTPTSTPTRTNSPANTSTVTGTATNNPTQISTPSNTATRTNTPTNTASVTPIRTDTPTSTLTGTATRTNTQTQTPTSTLTNTPTRTGTSTSTLTNTPTGIPTTTALTTQTPSPTQTTAAPSATQTFASTSTGTATETSIPTSTTTTTPTASQTSEPGSTITVMATSSPSASPTACSLQFEDVPSGHTFYAFVRCLACRGIINGYPCGGQGEPCVAPDNNPYFRPGNLVTRGQIAKIVSNSAGFAEPVSGQTFEDVAPGSTFYDFVERLSSREVMNGYPCGGLGEPCAPPSNRPYFRPNATATRGQISKIVSNAAGFAEQVSGQTFEDVRPGSTFYDFVERLVSRGVINGYPCGGPREPCIPPENRPYFRPGANVTRGQTTKIVGNTFLPDCTTVR